MDFCGLEWQQWMNSYPGRLWNLQLGLCRSFDSDDSLISEAVDGVDVLVRHVSQRAARGQGW